MTLTPVLMYHAVGEPRDSRFRPWTIAPALLGEHLSMLRTCGYEPIGMSEWIHGRDDRKYAVITFDDGYADFSEQAMPLLEAYQAHATVYVVTGYMGGQAQWLPFADERRRPMMTWADVRAVAAHGVEIGSHGHRHIELDVAPSAVAEEDVRISHRTLIDQGIQPDSFCYPFGYVNRRVRSIVMNSGFSSACLVGRGLAERKDPLLVRRLAISHRTSAEALHRLLAGPAVAPAARVRQAAQPAWRLARRLRQAAASPAALERRGPVNP